MSLPSFHPNSEQLRKLEELEYFFFADKGPAAACMDSFKRSSHASNGFSVSTYYDLLFQFSRLCVIEVEVVVALKEMWSFKIPSKIQIFLLRLFLDRLATKDQLLKRGIIFGGNVPFCILCNGSKESSHHLFLMCVHMVNVWKGVERWLCMKLVCDSSWTTSFLSFARSMRKEVGNTLENII